MSKKNPPTLDFSLGLPAYAQIIRQVQARLRDGTLGVGDRLPTVRALARELGVNFNTVARAYRVLHRERVLSVQQGRGTYVASIPSAKVKTRLRSEALRALTKRFLSEAQRLGCAKREIERAVKEGLNTEH